MSRTPKTTATVPAPLQAMQGGSQPRTGGSDSTPRDLACSTGLKSRIAC